VTSRMLPKANLSASRYEFASDFMHKFSKTHPGAIVFDVGAGDCVMREPVLSAGLTWIGFDLYPSSSAVHKWDLSEPCPLSQPKANIVLMLDVVEHLLNPGIAIQNIAKVMEPGGVIVMTTPNPRWSRSRTHHLLTGDLACFTQHDLQWNHHVFAPFPHIVSKILHDAGISVEEYITLDGPTRWPRPRLSLDFLPLCAEAAGRKLLERADPSACGMSYAFVARFKGAGARSAARSSPGGGVAAPA
jgi:hypothetical protein